MPRLESKDGEATIWIYDAIGELFGPDAVTAKGVRDRLHSLRAIERLTIRINSPGGLCDEACAIHTLLSEFPGEKLVKVDGVAASAAATVAMAGDRLTMASGAMMMIHNPWAIAIGDGDEMRKGAEIADKYRDSTAAIIAKRTGKPPKDVLAAMKAETWFTGDEAVAWGIAHESVEEEPAVAAYVDPDLFPYKHTPAALLKAVLNNHRVPRLGLEGYRVALARMRQKVYE